MRPHHSSMRTREICFANLLLLAVTGLRGASLAPAPNPEQARNLNNLGSLYFDRGDYTRAEAALSQAAAMGETSAFLNLAATLRAEGRYADAEKMYQRALEVRETEAEPSRKRIASALYGLALVYRDTGRYAKAEEVARRALDNGADSASALNLLGMVAQAQGRLADADDLLQRSLQAAELPDALINLGNVERQRGDLSSAQTHLERAVTLLKGASQENTRMAAALEGLAQLDRARGDLKQARLVGTRALLLLSESVGTSHPDYAAALSNLALVDQDRHDFRKARQRFLEAWRIDQQKLGPDHPRLATDLNNLGVASAQLHDYANAESYLRRALEAQPAGVQAAYWMANLASLLAHEGKHDEALGLFRNATVILCDANVAGDLRMASILEEYAALLRGAGSYAEAELAQTKAMHIRVRYVITRQESSNQI